MCSAALRIWRRTSADQLDQLFQAHIEVGGTKRGRRYATDQLNAAIVVQVAAQFQRFCRDIHTEAAEALIAAGPQAWETALRISFTADRKLDRTNATPDSIRRDFRLLGLELWLAAEAVDKRSADRRDRLRQLNAWRNAIAHQNFAFSAETRQLLADTALTLKWAKRWRSACNGLAASFDQVVGDHVTLLTGGRPW